MALTDLASSMKQAGIDVIGLAAGQPDFDTPAAIAAAGIAAINDGKTHYTPNTGTPQLRKAICNKLNVDNGLVYAEDEIIVSNGAKQSIWQALLACLSPGDEVIIPAPYWVSYTEMVKMAGGVPVVVETTATENFCLSPEKLRAALTDKSRVIIICTPSNPSGTVYSLAMLQGLADVVASHPRLMVLSDEIYELIIYPPHTHHSFAALPGMWDRTLTVNGMSKAFAMTGWRMGYLAAPRHFAKAAAVIQSQSTSGACSISQEASCAALAMGKNGGEAVAAMVEAFRERRDYIMSRLSAMPGMSIAEPQGAFYVLPDVSAYFGDGVHADNFGPVPDSDTLCRYLIEQAHVALVPGDAFGASQCLRISYAASMETIKEAMDRIEKHLHPSVFHVPPMLKVLDIVARRRFLARFGWTVPAVAAGALPTVMANSAYGYVKNYELSDALLPGCWIVVRIDGKGFTKFCEEHDFQKPNDQRALSLMDACALEVLNTFNDIRIGFGESDEYSFVFHKCTQLYGRRSSKLTSLVVSCFSCAYVRFWPLHIPDTPLKRTPMFDARAVCYPSDKCMRDYLAWRQVDTHINNQYNTCYWALRQQGGMSGQEAQDTLKGTLADAKNELLFTRFGINYAHLPAQFRKGSVAMRCTEACVVKVADDGVPVVRDRSILTILHVDLIGDKFWEEHPELLK